MFKLILSTSVYVFQALPFRHGYNHNPCIYLYSAPYVSHAPPIAPYLKSSRSSGMENNHDAPYCAITYISLLIPTT